MTVLAVSGWLQEPLWVQAEDSRQRDEVVNVDASLPSLQSAQPEDRDRAALARESLGKLDVGVAALLAQSLHVASRVMPGWPEGVLGRIAHASVPSLLTGRSECGVAPSDRSAHVLRLPSSSGTD